MVGGGGLPRGRWGRIIGGDMNNAEALTEFLDRWRGAGGGGTREVSIISQRSPQRLECTAGS